ncbi:hypothetical protein D9615_003202 [Tricholomella constricta]|uniref:FAD-binding domain-containing protein n=1 Tax=Tricholomella constricta TaxID=117010 RepID=A0A8H5M7G8_9AGAR|nr:hypothetical protein D9615_003202 [Tricholomella constricta]
MPFNIAIIGAGPVGLTLAHLLLKTPSTITVTIFERDASPSSRTTKGGTLDLHADTGLAALDAAGLRPAFDRVARYDPRSGGVVIADRHGKRVFTMPVDEGRENTRPEIDREDLKALLLDALPEGIVRWGAHVSGISASGQLLFHDDAPKPETETEAETGRYDLVVGADGAWSKVRAHITDTKPVFSGLSGWEMHVPTPDATHPEINITREVGHGLYFALGGGRALVGQRLGSGAIMLYAMVRGASPEALKDTLAACGGDLGRVRERVRGAYEAEGWARELCAWMDAAEPSTMRGWPLYEYALPDGHVWAHRRGWTLVGDAAHVMTPFAGEGVNAGMRDALELAKRISVVAERQGTEEALDEAVKEYEEEMFARLRPVMKATFDNKESMFNVKAPESFLGRIKEITGGLPPRQ